MIVVVVIIVMIVIIVVIVVMIVIVIVIGLVIVVRVLVVIVGIVVVFPAVGLGCFAHSSAWVLLDRVVLGDGRDVLAVVLSVFARIFQVVAVLVFVFIDRCRSQRLLPWVNFSGLGTGIDLKAGVGFAGNLGINDQVFYIVRFDIGDFGGYLLSGFLKDGEVAGGSRCGGGAQHEAGDDCGELVGEYKFQHR